MKQKFHYYIACIELTFVNGEQETGITRVNSTIKSDAQRIGIELLARAQQGAQITLIKNLNDESIQFLAAVFLSINYIGHQTDEEFNKRQAANDLMVAGNA